jgi:trk system potassium uptake protein TrkA
MELADDGSITEFRAVAITRGSQTIIPRGQDEFFEDDIVYIVSRKEIARNVAELSGHRNVEVKNMMILGGSRIGARIAYELQNDMNIKLVDYNGERAYRLAEELDKVLIIHEDGRDLDAMLEEGLTSMDAFVAVTGRSETNILAAMQAKRMGVKKVIAEVENLNYISLAESVGIDTIINKKRVTASNIFRFTMSTDVQTVRCLSGSDAEVMEFIVKPNSPATKHKVCDLGLPEDSIIGGVVRGDRVFIAVEETQINAYDRVVVFAMPDSVMRVAEFFN